MLDPNVRAILEWVKGQGRPALDTLPVPEARRAARENTAAAQGPGDPLRRVFDVAMDGQVLARVYEPDSVPPAPGLVYFHGGGWVLCDLETHDVMCRAIARLSGAIVVSVDYRLAPEHKFPAAVDDAYAATAWVARHCDELGIDASRLCVGGDSAGGNLATVVAMKSRDCGWPSLALQVLVYPVTDLSSFETQSYVEFAEGHQLTRSLMLWFRDHYLPNVEDGKNPHASPLLAEDLRDLPPALVITAECDPLRDEGEAYARRMQQAGVDVILHRYEGMIHPFFSMPALIPQATAAYEEIAEAVRNARVMMKVSGG